MSKHQKVMFLFLGIVVSSILWLSVSLVGQSTTDTIKEFWPKEIGKNRMAFVPKEYGRLVDIELYHLDRRHNIAELWFEDDNGTIRIVFVDKGKSADFEPVIDDRVRVIPRK